jgi:ribosomal-protein-alanine N-acetyltransferase
VRASDWRVETKRLTPIPFTAELMEVFPERDRAQQLIAAAIPDGWPDDELSGLLSAYAEWLNADASVVGYGPWIVIVRAEGIVAGSAGFVGAPNAGGTIELGFGIHCGFRNRGYASEAARALVEWGLDQPAVTRVLAKCDRDNLASARVLEKIGMSQVGSADGRLLWEVALPMDR